jgi:hypothetical protein
MMVRIALLLGICTSLWLAAQDVPYERGLLTRRYQEGETLKYRMKATNDNWRYEIQATGVVKKNSAGKYIEEYAWSGMVSDGSAITLSPATAQFREVLSLDPVTPPSIPNLSTVDTKLIGPITDLLTFYADLWLAARVGVLAHTGDHFYQKMGIPSSWADGNYVLVGEDAVDFDMQLEDVDQTAKVATLLVRHVPPAQPKVKLPAAWMKEAPDSAAINWVQVSRKDDKFLAAMGTETFDVRMKINLANGEISSGVIENLVKAQERDCRDRELTICSDPRPIRNMRHIEIALER